MEGALDGAAAAAASVVVGVVGSYRRVGVSVEVQQRSTKVLSVSGVWGQRREVAGHLSPVSPPPCRLPSRLVPIAPGHQSLNLPLTYLISILHLLRFHTFETHCCCYGIPGRVVQLSTR